MDFALKPFVSSNCPFSSNVCDLHWAISMKLNVSIFSTDSFLLLIFLDAFTCPNQHLINYVFLE